MDSWAQSAWVFAAEVGSRRVSVTAWQREKIRRAEVGRFAGARLLCARVPPADRWAMLLL
jgi:hypothetical protein